MEELKEFNKAYQEVLDKVKDSKNVKIVTGEHTSIVKFLDFDNYTSYDILEDNAIETAKFNVQVREITESTKQRYLLYPFSGEGLSKENIKAFNMGGNRFSIKDVTQEGFARLGYLVAPSLARSDNQFN